MVTPPKMKSPLLGHAAVELDAAFGVGQAGDAVHALEDVGEVAEGLFILLRRLVADVGEGAEGGDVGEVAPVAHVAHVPGALLAAGYAPRAGGAVALGEAEGRGDVVGRAEGKIAHGRPRAVADAHEALDDVGERPVAAHAADEVIARAPGGDVDRLPRAGGEAHGRRVARRVQHVQRLAEAVLVHTPPCDGVYYHKQTLHSHITSRSGTARPCRAAGRLYVCRRIPASWRPRAPPRRPRRS